MYYVVALDLDPRRETNDTEKRLKTPEISHSDPKVTKSNKPRITIGSRHCHVSIAGALTADTVLAEMDLVHKGGDRPGSVRCLIGRGLVNKSGPQIVVGVRRSRLREVFSSNADLQRSLFSPAPILDGGERKSATELHPRCHKQHRDGCCLKRSLMKPTGMVNQNRKPSAVGDPYASNRNAIPQCDIGVTTPLRRLLLGMRRPAAEIMARVCR
ncbi:hypothetical protein L484_025601 [Morus notabilis]|uniref:Uncharacterized protein n=1 Tax=Morus notabilis TaxID=981085 RepID=W9RXI5_9ROSA|nr:hypothetical protein L484_025601 [Morus notabilis]